MPNFCCVPKCNKENSGSGEKLSMFMVPKDEELRTKWEENIPGSRRLQSFHRVCENHFQKNCIIREYNYEDSNGTIMARVSLKKPRLVKSSVPTIFIYDSKIIIECDKENNSNVANISNNKRIMIPESTNKTEYVDRSTSDNGTDTFQLKLHESDFTCVRSELSPTTSTDLMYGNINKTEDVTLTDNVDRLTSDNNMDAFELKLHEPDSVLSNVTESNNETDRLNH